MGAASTPSVGWEKPVGNEPTFSPFPGRTATTWRTSSPSSSSEPSTPCWSPAPRWPGSTSSSSAWGAWCTPWLTSCGSGRPHAPWPTAWRSCPASPWPCRSSSPLPRIGNAQQVPKGHPKPSSSCSLQLRRHQDGPDWSGLGCGGACGGAAGAAGICDVATGRSPCLRWKMGREDPRGKGGDAEQASLAPVHVLSSRKGFHRRKTGFLAN